MKYLKSKISNAGKAWFQLILNGEIAQNANGQKSSTKQESSGGAVLECLLTMTEVLGSIPGEALTLIFCLDVELFFLSFFLSVFPEQLLQSTPPFFSPLPLWASLPWSINGLSLSLSLLFLFLSLYLPYSVGNQQTSIKIAALSPVKQKQKNKN